MGADADLELAVLFWCYKELDVCVSRLRLLRHYNPGTPVYVLFGGNLTEADQFETAFGPYVDDFYAFPEEKSADWKWWRGDVLLSRWFSDRGHRLRWDSVAVLQWDMLTFAPVEKLFMNMKKNELLLSGAWPMLEIDWVRTDFLQSIGKFEFQNFVRHYDFDEADIWWCVFVVVVLPREFLMKFSERADPEIGFLEYSIPTLAKFWGFEIRQMTRDHRYNSWQADHPYNAMLTAAKSELQRRHVLMHLLEPGGLRIFHPYYQPLNTDQLTLGVPAWLNFFRCSDWKPTELFGNSTRALLRHAIAGTELSLPDPMTNRPAICLNMVVHNDAPVIESTLNSAAPLIDSWVIVDVGSTDGTPDLIRSRMTELNIVGELHHRPNRGGPANQTESLRLAQGNGDYILVVDAGDTIIGTPDFAALREDFYWLRHSDGEHVRWRAQLFRDGVVLTFSGRLGDYQETEDRRLPVGTRLAGRYHLASRQDHAPDPNPLSHAIRERELILAVLARQPDDAHLVFSVAQRYFEAGDLVQARAWFSRHLALARAEQVSEETFIALWRFAETMAALGEPWPAVRNAFLEAWAVRPTRVEPLLAIAQQSRARQLLHQGYLFATLAAQAPIPDGDILSVATDVYAWRATDERAHCAALVGRSGEALTLWQTLLLRTDIPDNERSRIEAARNSLLTGKTDRTLT
jgi:hypothetical protein